LDARIYGFATNKIPRDPFWRARFGIGRWEFDCIDERGIRASVDNECVPNFTTDPDGLGACVALMRKVLPGAYFGVCRTSLRPGMIPGGSDKAFAATCGDWGYPVHGYHDNICCAALLAIISAKIAELEAEQEKERVG
jgi:hypothetical protein